MIKKLRQTLDKKGITLVETLVSLSVMFIMLTMLAMIITPAYKVLRRIQTVQSVQVILDNLGEELQGIAREAEGSVKIYSQADEIADRSGASSGEVLEFVNTDSNVVLVTAAGDSNREVTLVRGDPAQNIGKLEFENGSFTEPKAGRLFSRYYLRKKQDNSVAYTYAYRVDEKNVARAMGEAFGEGFYMEHYVKITFSYPNNIGNGDLVPYIKATLELYDDAAMTHRVTSAEKDLDFRYEVRRYDATTATEESKNP